ncbi:hypothetical protein GCM10025868_19850 [Angustibacter aerolatus]|uniref:Uncharacterized protein n=1 Tax=Angustibacter aerolatus TaxID=1162965 RepID=A0ABQ6JHN3_9ACTN|nr:hypothetical protein [Angustibacter aerolatus]GMA86735.1 hypothetical protein GCM10025868_19850 [Angustibacter aerolatus]
MQDPAWAWSDFYEGERQAATVDGKVVGLPALVDNLALVYNKKPVRAGGRRRADRRLDVAGLPQRGAAAHLGRRQAVRLGVRRRRLGGHHLAVRRDALAGRRPACSTAPASRRRSTTRPA